MVFVVGKENTPHQLKETMNHKELQQLRNPKATNYVTTNNNDEGNTVEHFNYLTSAKLATYREMYKGKPFPETFQRTVTRDMGALVEITVGELREALKVTEFKFEQEPVTPVAVAKLVKSILDDEALYQPVTLTQCNGEMYITGGRNRTTAILFISDIVLGNDTDESVVECVLQFVEHESVLYKLVETDNASRIMRASEKGITARLEAGIEPGGSIADAVGTINQAEHSKAERALLLTSLIVSKNREEHNRFAPQTVHVVARYFVSQLVAATNDEAVTSEWLGMFWNYFQNHYGELSNSVDGKVARNYKEVAMKVMGGLYFTEYFTKTATVTAPAPATEPATGDVVTFVETAPAVEEVAPTPPAKKKAKRALRTV